MQAFRKLLNQEDGQGLVEYTLILVLVALVLWVAVKETTLAAALTSNWNTVSTCVSAPFTCGSAS